MANTKMGFEGLIYYGAAGALATQQMTNAKDISEDFGTTEGPTTVRGAGEAAPLECGRVCGRNYSIEFVLPNKANDTILAALITAAVAGNPVAIRTKAFATGKGFNGDVNLKFKRSNPLSGPSEYTFTCTMNNDSRDPLLDV